MSLQPHRYSRLVYLASPYTADLDGLKLWRFTQAAKAADILCQAGWLIYSPIAQTVPMAKYGNRPDETTWDDWKEFDEAFVKRCDMMFVLLLPGWQESTGVTAELVLARSLDMPIIGVNPVTHELRRLLQEDLAHLPPVCTTPRRKQSQ